MKFHRLLFAVVLMSLFALSGVAQITVGAERPDKYLPLLSGKRVALLSNHTGTAFGRHTLDVLLDNGVDVRVLFSPEHGFRGTADAGQHVASGRDQATGLPIVSLYGKGHALRADSAVRSVDIVVTDLQDVGTRFYTYYITMMELMEAAARHNKEFVVFDRPNPNGMVVDGPLLDPKLRSGVGRIPVPAVHGMTMAELALMINGERWLSDGLKVDRLHVVPCLGYDHSMSYSLPVAPSPNLRSDIAVALYPSLCYFEGTPVSVGRGTDNPFTMYGHPTMKSLPFRFTPRSMTGATNPPCKGRLCYGRDFSHENIDSVHARGINLDYLIEAYRLMSPGDPKFFRSFVDNLFGDASVRRSIERGDSAAAIKRSWQPALDRFRDLRARYLLYP